MRVLQVTAIPITAERFVVPLAQALIDARFQVEFATGPGRELETLESRGFRVHRLPISRRVLAWRNLHAVGALRALIQAGRFNIIHVHTPVAATVARLAARGQGVRVLYTMHGSLWGAGVRGWRRAFFTGIERALGRGTDFVFTVNAEDADDCVRRARLPGEQVVTLPAGGAGVAPEFFQDEDASNVLRRRARKQVGLEPNLLVVGYVGRTVAAKGMRTLARAFGLIARQEHRARLLVVGDALEGDRGAYSEARFLREVGPPSADRVLWTGFRDRVAPLVAAMDVVVLPSLREGFGMSLAEAAALGRPVVATETRGARAVVEPGVTGLLVPVGDTAALGGAVLGLLTNPDRAAQLGAAGRRRAAERFTREAVLRAYLERYDTFRAAAPPPLPAER